MNGYITRQPVIIGLRKEADRLILANPAHPFPRAHSVIDALFKSGLWREGWGLRNMDLKAILCAVKQKLHYQVTYFQQKRTQSWDEFSPFLRTLHLFLTFLFWLPSFFFVKFSLHYFLIQSVINLFFLHKTANSRWRKNVLCYTISQEPNQIRDEKLIQAKHWLTWKRKKENIITLHKKYILWHFYPFWGVCINAAYSCWLLFWLDAPPSLP